MIKLPFLRKTTYYYRDNFRKNKISIPFNCELSGIFTTKLIQNNKANVLEKPITFSYYLH